MRVNIITLMLVSLMAVYGGGLLAGNRSWISWIPGVDEHGSHGLPPIPANQYETIFIALEREVVPVPVERAGSGGAVTSLNDDLIVMTHEGGFFDVTGNNAERLDIAPPENGLDAMIAFDDANAEYTFPQATFRFNDVDTHDDKLIVSFTEWVADGNCYRTSIAVAPLNGAVTTSEISIAQTDWDLLYATSPCLPPKTQGNAIEGHMAGSRFVIGDDNKLYLASGDYAIDGNYAPIPISQDPAQEYGKIISVDLQTGAAEIVSQGHSNTQGIAFDGAGDLFAVEHGRRGGDEINRIVAGTDYGWPKVSLGTRYNRLPLPDTLDYGRHLVYEPPVYSWLPSVAVSSLTYLDDFHPAWDGDLIAGSLAAQSLFRIRMRDGRVLFNERIPLGVRIRYVHQHGSQIILWTDQLSIIKLSVGEFGAGAQFALNKISQLGLNTQQQERVELALDRCSECHSLGVVAGGNAPALGAVFGRDIAAEPGYPYSDALLSQAGSWTRESLISYLDDPDAFATGTSMPNPELDDPVVVNALVDILEALRSQPE